MQATHSTISASETQKAVDPIVTDIFSKLRVMYGGKFDHMFQSKRAETTQRRISVAMMEWSEKLEGVSRPLIAYALKQLGKECEQAKRLGKEAWPPSADQFVALCKPEPVQLGLPTVREAYTAAVNRSMDLVRAFPEVGVAMMRIKRETWERGEHYSYPAFKREYQAIVERHASGERFDNQAIAALPDHSKPDAEQARKYFDEMKKAIRGKA